MLHGQITFLYEFDTLASAAAFLWTTPSSWVWLLLFQGIPLGLCYTLKSGTFCYLMRSLGSRFFQHTFPSYCIREASSVAPFFFLGGRGVGRYSCYTTIALPFRRQHTARRYGTITASVLSIYQFECGGSGCVRIWLCLGRCGLPGVCAWLDWADSVAILSNIRFYC